MLGSDTIVGTRSGGRHLGGLQRIRAVLYRQAAEVAMKGAVANDERHEPRSLNRRLEE